jgi:DNA-binding beta-propeller fold protein YncE
MIPLPRAALRVFRRCSSVLVLLVFASTLLAALPLDSPVESELWLIHGKDAYVVPPHSSDSPVKLELGEGANHVVLSPDGKLAAVAIYGPITHNFAWGGVHEYWPKGENLSAVVLLKRPEYQLLGRYPVPFRPALLAFTADSSTLLVVSYGQVSKNEKKHISPRVSFLDIAAGKLKGETPLSSEPADSWHIPSSNLMILALRGFEKRPGSSPELVVVNTATQAIEKSPLPAPPVRFHDSGEPRLRYLELTTGVVLVNAEGKLVGSLIEAGTQKRLFVRGPDGRYFLGGKTEKKGKLIILDKGQVLKSLDVPPPDTLVYSPKTSRFILCAGKEAILFDARDFSELGRAPLPGTILEVRLDPTETRLYVNELGDSVTVVDLQEKKKLAQFSTGRGGVKFMQGLAAASVTALAQMQYQLVGYYPVGYPMGGFSAGLPQAVKTMAFSPSGNFLYVFNSRTMDITVVETKTHTSPQKIATGFGVGPSSLYLRKDGAQFLSCSSQKLLLFDSGEGKLLLEKQIPKTSLHYDPEMDAVFAFSPAAVEVFRPGDADTLKKFDHADFFAFRPEARRFILVDKTGVRVYDYNLNLVHTIPGAANPDTIHVVPLNPPAAPAAM